MVAGQDASAALLAGAPPRTRPSVPLQGPPCTGAAVLQIGRAVGNAAPVLTGRSHAEDGAPDVVAPGGVVRPVAEGDVAEGRPILAAGPPVVAPTVAGSVGAVRGPTTATPSLLSAAGRGVTPLLFGVEGPVLRLLRAGRRPLLAAPDVAATPPRVRLGGAHAAAVGATGAAAATVKVAAVPVLVTHPAGDAVVAQPVRVGGAEQGGTLLPVARRRAIATANEAGGLVAVDTAAARTLRRPTRGMSLRGVVGALLATQIVEERPVPLRPLRATTGRPQGLAGEGPPEAPLAVAAAVGEPRLVAGLPLGAGGEGARVEGPRRRASIAVPGLAGQVGRPVVLLVRDAEASAPTTVPRAATAPVLQPVALQVGGIVGAEGVPRVDPGGSE